MTEMEQKEKKLREYMAVQGHQGILLFRRDTFSWITCGRINHIIHSTEFGMCALLITADSKYCIANQVEKYRMMEEELAGLGYELLEINWWEEDYVECARRHVGNISIAADKDVPGICNVYADLQRLRFSLLPEEIERYRELALICTNAVEETCREICPGDTEHEVLANMARKVMRLGIEPSVALVASDERIFKYRHPIDTAKKIDRYAMVVLCGRKYGLVANLTRFVHFGKPAEEIVEKSDLVRRIHAEVITHTVPGRNIKDIFKVLVEAYKDVGYPDEWTLLHQGGPTGYATRDFIATPDYDERVYDHQAYTWNPSIAGAKSEDTILVRQDGFEILTDSHNWPAVEVQAKNGVLVKLPDLLIR